MTELMFQKPAPEERSTTISVNERDVRAAMQLLKALVASQEADWAEARPSPARTDESGLNQADLVRRARIIFAARRKRSQIFGKGMFGEPAWDMLIALYAGDTDGARVTIGRLSELTEAPLTTAIRWLDYLEQQGLVHREPHPTDRRAIFVELTDKGRSVMERYLSGTDL